MPEIRRPEVVLAKLRKSVTTSFPLREKREILLDTKINKTYRVEIPHHGAVFSRPSSQAAAPAPKSLMKMSLLDMRLLDMSPNSAPRSCAGQATHRQSQLLFFSLLLREKGKTLLDTKINK